MTPLCNDDQFLLGDSAMRLRACLRHWPGTSKRSRPHPSRMLAPECKSELSIAAFTEVHSGTTVPTHEDLSLNKNVQSDSVTYRYPPARH